MHLDESQPKGYPVDYEGNGAYTFEVTFFAATDTSCLRPQTTATFKYNVNAHTGVGAPQGALLTRRPFEPGLLQYRIPIDPNPGAEWTNYDIWYQINGSPNPDAGVGKQTFVDQAGGSFAPMTFPQPGTYTFISRIKKLGATSAWSQPVTYNVLAPFDFVGKQLIFQDGRGPSYKVQLRVVEQAAAGGRLTVKLARGKKGKRYRRIGTARISRSGIVTKRFTLRRAGHYRMRFEFKGNDLVAPGWADYGIRITRRRTFVP